MPIYFGLLPLQPFFASIKKRGNVPAMLGFSPESHGAHRFEIMWTMSLICKDGSCFFLVLTARIPDPEGGDGFALVALIKRGIFMLLCKMLRDENLITGCSFECAEVWFQVFPSCLAFNGQIEHFLDPP